MAKINGNKIAKCSIVIIKPPYRMAIKIVKIIVKAWKLFTKLLCSRKWITMNFLSLFIISSSYEHKNDIKFLLTCIFKRSKEHDNLEVIPCEI